MGDELVLPLILGGIGCIGACVGTALFLKARAFRSRASRTVGTVKTVVPDDTPAILHQALTVKVIAFVDSEGQQRQIPYESPFGRLRDGDPVPVLFDVHNPVAARIDSRTSLQLPVVAATVGILLLAFSLLDIVTSIAATDPLLRLQRVQAEWTTERIVFMLMFGGFGGALALEGYIRLYKSLRLTRRGVRTAGVVVGHETTHSRRNSGPGYQLFHHPVIEFEDETGTTQRKRMSVGTGSIEHAEGYGVEIVFDPTRPESAKVVSFSQLWAMGLMMSALGTIGVVIALAVWFFGIEVTGP